MMNMPPADDKLVAQVKQSATGAIETLGLSGFPAITLQLIARIEAEKEMREVAELALQNEIDMRKADTEIISRQMQRIEGMIHAVDLLLKACSPALFYVGVSITLSPSDHIAIRDKLEALRKSTGVL